MLCIHHNDLDGHCAAAIVELAYKKGKFPTDTPPVRFLEMDYNKELDLNEIRPDELVVIVDFSLKPEIMEKVLVITHNIIWIDHHKTAMDYKYSVKPDGLRGFYASGCKLTWQYFFEDEPVPLAVELISDYDNWDWRHGAETERFYVGMDARSHGVKEFCWDMFLTRQDITIYPAPQKEVMSAVELIQKDGKACIMLRNQLAEYFTKEYGYEAEMDGVKVFVVNFNKFGSKLFEPGGYLDKYDYCLTYIFDGEMYNVGVYTKNKNCHAGDLAAKYGGGGHFGAAGFRVEELPFKKIQSEDRVGAD